MNLHAFDRDRANFMNQHGLIPITTNMCAWWATYTRQTFDEKNMDILYTLANAITEKSTIAMILASGVTIHLVPTHFSIYPARSRIYICGDNRHVFIGHIAHCSVIAPSDPVPPSTPNRQEVRLALFPNDSFDLERIAFTLHPYLTRFINEHTVLASFPQEERPQFLRILRSLGSRAVPEDQELRQDLLNSLLDWITLYE